MMIRKKVKRIGMVIGTNPDKIDLYKEIHSDWNPGVRDLLMKYNYRNFSIFIQKMPDDKEYLFAYFEYVGDDFEKDTAEMKREPRYIEWLSVSNSCQVPLKGSSSWKTMDKVFYME